MLKVVFIKLGSVTMKLSNSRLGERSSVRNVGGDRAFRRRLMELGLVPGTVVELVSVAPLGDPIELLVRGASLSIRKAEASCIEIDLIARRSDVENVLEPAVAGSSAA